VDEFAAAYLPAELPALNGEEIKALGERPVGELLTLQAVVARRSHSGGSERGLLTESPSERQNAIVVDRND
jgi:hypothetical protein